MLRSFIIRKTSAYEDRQNSAVIPVYILLANCARLAEWGGASWGAYISPSVVLLLEVESPSVIRARIVGAVEAVRRRTRILHVPGVRAQEVSHVRPARLAARRIEARELLGVAFDVDVPDDGAEEAADEVVEGVEVVEPVAPEGLHGVVGDDDAAEGDEARADEERVHDCGEVLVGGVGGDGLADGGVEELVD